MSKPNPLGIWIQPIGLVDGHKFPISCNIRILLENLDIKPERYIAYSYYSNIRIIFRSMQDKNLFLLSTNLELIHRGPKGKKVYRYAA